MASEFTDGCTFDAELSAGSGGDEVLVLPTGAAYEHPQRLVDAAIAWFAALGARPRGLDVLARPDAFDAGQRRRGPPAPGSSTSSADRRCTCARCSRTRRSGTRCVEAWDDGAVLAGSSAGAMVLCDPMVDPRGGAFTLGLGLLADLA